MLGTGKVGGRLVVACGEDFTMSGGSPNVAGLRKSVYAAHDRTAAAPCRIHASWWARCRDRYAETLALELDPEGGAVAIAPRALMEALARRGQ